MPAELLWNERAEQDLLEIHAYILFDDPAAADRLLDQLRHAIELLVLQPRLGPRRSDIRPSVRVLTERPYLVLYQTHPDSNQGPIDSIEIVRIIDGRRDLRNLL